ncbi:MAG: DUF5995 family protein [Urechidicola sp.]|nr:DUF5995 family protein [Urechidicola sp.]
MNLQEINTIDQVIEVLNNIIVETKNENNPLGYFAALYKKVTVKVKEGFASNYFDDAARMEKLDVIFAKRYLEAYYKYQSNEKTTQSWKIAFELSTNYWPIVLQHLLIGMNAHINLDLGIAAAKVSEGKDIKLLKNDFNKINEILSSLVNEVQNDLAQVWPKLKYLLKISGKADDFLVDFSMKLARDGAWKFAESLAEDPINLNLLIDKRDQRIAEKAIIVIKPGFIISTIFGIIRLGEKGSVADRINYLNN